MARSLVQSKISKALRKRLRGAAASEHDGLLPGNMRLYSYYTPSLQAGIYGIEALQSITAIAGDDKADQAQKQLVYNYTGSIDNPVDDAGQPCIQKQLFTVVAPQFSLDLKLIDTYYPPDGHEDEGRILPHIVFNDPHVPWLRKAGQSPWMASPVDLGADISEPVPIPAGGAKGRNLMPWLALFVFRPEELQVSRQDAQLLHLDQLKSWDPTKTPTNGAYAMTVGQYLSVIKSRVYYEIGYQGAKAKAEFASLTSSEASTSVIFPLKAQVEALVHGKNGDLAPLKAQRLLSHVRHINTAGMPEAGVEEEGFFSVVVSMMTGDQKEVTPSLHMVHLVSLEHLDATLTNPSSSYFSNTHSDRIGLVSLFSWTYTCIPDAVSFEQTMAALAEAAQPLRPPKEMLQDLRKAAVNTKTADGAASAILFDRLNAGYTLARWRTPTGEESVAFARGPLAPMLPQEVPTLADPSKPTRPWPALSMTGKDYAVFDSSIGIMDVTYSSAWSLGKLVAISDSVFNAALMRFRSSVWSDASSTTRMSANGVEPNTTVLRKALSAVGAARAVAGADFSGPVLRINKPVAKSVDTSMADPKLTEAFHDAIDKAVHHRASAGEAMFNGFDGVGANNSDWEIILNWIHSVMYLALIPAHVLFPDPSFLQSHNASPVPKDQPTFHPEALRFFYIDHAWIDAFIDGALSCANHLEPEFDYTRLRIKTVFNDFLSKPIGRTALTPPVPRYGFVIRSAAVKSTPDLRLTVRCWKRVVQSDGTNVWVEDPDRDPLVRHTRMDDFTILSLVDCLPEEICVIKFAQPPHQQRFAIDSTLTYDADTGLVTSVETKMVFTRLYTDEKQAPSRMLHDPDVPAPLDPGDALMWQPLDKPHQPVDQKGYYDPDTRCIAPVEIAQDANKNLKAWASQGIFKKPPYSDSVPNSCVLGLELNDHSCQLNIMGVRPAVGSPEFPAWTRKLYMGDHVPTAFAPSASRSKARALIALGKVGAGPKTVPRESIKTAVRSPSIKAIAPPPVLLNSMNIVTTTTAATQSIPSARSADPFVDSSNPAFELLVHPDYRPPPPRPNRKAKGSNNAVFSPLDYIPTKTQSAFDLIFAIRRRSNAGAGRHLKSLTIEVPVSVAGSKPDTDGLFREPLLVAGDFSAAGIRMCSNLRFVPTVESGPASSVGSPHWDHTPVLILRLAPVSSRNDGTMLLHQNAPAADASVRLAQPPIAPVVDSTSTALIAQGKDAATGKTRNAQLSRGISLVRLSEQYGDGRADEWSWCLVLKLDSGDKDPWGNVI